MKKLFTITLITIYSLTCYSQKKNETYIKEAKKIAQIWLKDINNDQLGNAYNLLHEEALPKQKNDSITWCKYMINEQKEFGMLEKRTITNQLFTSEVEELETGFYVFLEYSSDYANIEAEVSETILLKQDDYTNWKILNYRPVWLTPSSKNE